MFCQGAAAGLDDNKEGASRLAKGFGDAVKVKVLLDGMDVLDPEIDVIELRRRVGVVFSRPIPLPLTIFKNISFGLEVAGENDKEVLSQKVEHALELVGMAGYNPLGNDSEMKIRSRNPFDAFMFFVLLCVRDTPSAASDVVAWHLETIQRCRRRVRLGDPDVLRDLASTSAASAHRTLS